jgi:hypothetical protein
MQEFADRQRELSSRLVPPEAQARILNEELAQKTQEADQMHAQGRYRDELGAERRVPLAADKTAAQAMLNELVRKAERRIAGLEDPFETHRRTPLEDHLTVFRQYLEGKGNTPKHAWLTHNRAKAAMESCKFKFVTDVTEPCSTCSQQTADSDVPNLHR